MAIINLAFGFLFLVAGHQLPWLFVAGTAFMLGTPFADLLGIAPGVLERISFSFACAAIGVLLGYYLRKLVVALAAFYTGGMAFLGLAHLLAWDFSAIRLPVFLLSGAIAALLVLAWYHWALILVSVLGGAILIIQNFSITGVSSSALFVVCIIFGLTSQFILHQYILPIEEQVTPGSP